MPVTKLIKKIGVIIFVACIAVLSCGIKNANAESAFSVSPMNQRISLVPGERYYGTFKVTNPADSDYDFHYKLSIEPFKVDENYEAVFENNGDYSQIVDWIGFESEEGVISPNNTNVIKFFIDVPADAPAGGQYAAIFVNSINDGEVEGGVNIANKYAIAHILYTDVAGETKRSGTIDKLIVPSFLFSGNITATAAITNAGNVHSDATYILQVFPLFSNEEVYTNEEDPKILNILPGTTRTKTIEWNKTPSIGIFHTIFNVEYEGVNRKVDKIVIICPLWLLFLILLALFLLIFKIVSRKKKARD